MQREKQNRDMAEELRKRAVKVYENLVADNVYRQAYRNRELMVFADRSYRQLKDFEYNIGIIGVQSSGKTSVLNTLLGYPYMPVAGVVTTCAVAHIKYRKEFGIEVCEHRGKQFAIDLGGIGEELFNELKLYACSCIKEYDIEQLNYFMTASEINEDGKRIVKPENLKLDYGNIRHRVILVLNILLCYVDMNADPQFLKQEVLDIIAWRSRLLPKLGFSKAAGDYTVTLYCDSPVLQQGLAFTDLPGLGADVGQGSGGMSSHDQITLDEAKKVDAVMFIMTPTMTADDKKPIKDILPIFTGRKISNAENKLIPIVNKIDMVEGGGYKNKVDELYAECGLSALDSRNTFDISAKRAEKRLFDLNSELRLDRSWCAHSLPECFRTDEMIRQGMESNYEKSNFDVIYDYILTYLPKAMTVEALQLMLYVYQEISSVMTVEKAGLEINEQFMHSGVDASVKLIKVLEDSVAQVVGKGSTKQKNASEKILDDFKLKVLSEKAQRDIADNFTALVKADHCTMAQEVQKYGNLLLEKANMFGDIVLSRKNGQKKEVENTENWEKLKKRVLEEDYSKGFAYFQREVGNMDEKFIDKIKDTDHTLEVFIEELGEELWRVLEEQRKSLAVQSVRGVLYAAAQGQLSNAANHEAAKKVIAYIQESADKAAWGEYQKELDWIARDFDPGRTDDLRKLPGIPETVMITVDTMKMVDVVIGQMKEVYANVQNEVNTCFDAQNKDIEAARDGFLIDVTKRKLEIKNEYNKRNIEFLESIVEKGIVFTKVELITSSKLTAALEGKLDLSAEDIRKYDTLVCDMLKKLFGDYTGLTAEKSKSLYKVWAGLNENLHELTKYISGYVVESEAFFKGETAKKRAMISSFAIDKSIDGWFEELKDNQDYREMFSGEVARIKELHKGLVRMQDEVGA